MLVSWFYENLPLFFFVSHSFLHYHIGDDLQDLQSALLAEELVALFFAWNVTQRVLRT